MTTPGEARGTAAIEAGPIVVLNEAELRGLVGLDVEALAAIEEAFSRLAAGQADVPPIVGLFVPERRGEIDVKAAYVHGLPSLAIKIASGFFDNHLHGLPSGSGLMVVLSTVTGFPQAILLDNGYLTDVRTALAGAAAAKYLAPKRVRTVGVIGAGTQGRFQVKALGLVRSFERVLVHDRSAETADAYVREMSAWFRSRGPEAGRVEVARAEPEALVREGEVVVTCTPSHEPIVRAAWLHAGLHITAMGADTKDKQELEAGVLAGADRLACDLKAQCVERGELVHALTSGALPVGADVTELGELTSGRRAGRQRDEEITVCALTGVGVQDTAIALLACARARAGGIGARFPGPAGAP